LKIKSGNLDFGKKKNVLDSMIAHPLSKIDGTHATYLLVSLLELFVLPCDVIKFVTKSQENLMYECEFNC
jgi:hypothetical protein